MKLYRIAWKTKAGNTGHGTSGRPYAEAKAYADDLNTQHVDICLDHWPELIEDENPSCKDSSPTA